MKKLLAALFMAFAAWASPAHAQSTSPVVLPSGCGTGAFVNSNGYLTLNPTGQLCVNASVSASVSGFQPSASGARGTPISVTTSDSSGTAPTGAVVLVSDVGTTIGMYCNANGIAATSSDQFISANGGWFAFTMLSGVTTIHCIGSGGSTTANMVGGSGLPTGTGGGSGGGSGGSVNVTQWDTTALGVPTAYGTAPTTGNYIGVNAYVTNALNALINSADSIAPISSVTPTAGTSPVNSYLYGFDGTNYDRLRVDANFNLKTVPQAFPAGGWTMKHIVAAGSDNATNLKSTPGTVHAVEVYGIDAAPAYLKFYNTSSSPTCGSSTVVKSIMIPAAPTAANGAGSNAIVLDAAFTTGISYCVVKGIADTDDTSVDATSFIINIDYN